MLTGQAFERLCRARTQLEHDDDRQVTVDEIARRAGMSPFHFIRRFRALFGDTPHQTRIKARIERARRLLAVTDFPVVDICVEVGFTSLASFSHLFTRHVGTPPAAYRRRVRALSAGRRAVPKEATPGCLTLMVEAFATFDKPEPPALPHLEA